MSERPTVLRNTERMLWAEAIGHCMNPECQVELIENGISMGEMAHIIRHADGGDVSFDNLVLLCGNCHTLTEHNRTKYTLSQLREWKNNRNSEIEGRFARRYGSFKELQRDVTPLLKRNGQIFDSYGPANDQTHSAERYKLWLKFESEIIANNRRLELMLTKNQDLLHMENQTVVDLFVAHSREFITTRDDSQVQRVHLFPQDLLSIFGLEESLSRYPPSLSALQNFLSYLIDMDRFVSLQLNGEPCVEYLDKGTNVVINLRDRPRMQQIFWSGRFFKKPDSTDMRIENLIFIVQWLNRNNIRYEFTNITDLTEMVLNGKFIMKLRYDYVLSVSDMHRMTLNRGDIVVNLNNWGGTPISKDAYDYATKIRVHLFAQGEFFRFAHSNLK